MRLAHWSIRKRDLGALLPTRLGGLTCPNAWAKSPVPRAHYGPRGMRFYPTYASLRPVLEISQIRRRLVLANRHQHAVVAHEIALLANGGHRVVFDAGTLGPART